MTLIKPTTAEVTLEGAYAALERSQADHVEREDREVAREEALVLSNIALAQALIGAADNWRFS